MESGLTIGNDVMLIERAKGLQHSGSMNQQLTASNQNTNGAIPLSGGVVAQLHQILQHGQRQQVNCIFSPASVDSDLRNS